jgi:phosphohistidine phosphatase
VKLYLLRHGIAIDRDDPACPPDPERMLTERGVRRTRAAARGLAALGVRADLVVTSPYRRAVETAAIAAEELGVGEDRVVRSDLLLFGADPDELLDWLAKREEKAVLAVGHAPHLDLLLAAAVGPGDRELTRIKKAGCAAVRLGEPAGRPGHLEWLLPPRVLRRLGSGADGSDDSGEDR